MGLSQVYLWSTILWGLYQNCDWEYQWKSNLLRPLHTRRGSSWSVGLIILVSQQCGRWHCSRNWIRNVKSISATQELISEGSRDRRAYETYEFADIMYCAGTSASSKQGKTIAVLLRGSSASYSTVDGEITVIGSDKCPLLSLFSSICWLK